MTRLFGGGGGGGSRFSGASMTASPGQVIPSGAETFFTAYAAGYDTDSYVTVDSSDVFTVPSDGKYRIVAGFLSAASWGAGDWSLHLYPGGNIVVPVANLLPSGHKPSGQVVFEGVFAQGDVVDLSLTQSSGSNQTAYSYAMIQRIG